MESKLFKKKRWLICLCSLTSLYLTQIKCIFKTVGFQNTLCLICWNYKVVLEYWTFRQVILLVLLLESTDIGLKPNCFFSINSFYYGTKVFFSNKKNECFIKLSKSVWLNNICMGQWDYIVLLAAPIT